MPAYWNASKAEKRSRRLIDGKENHEERIINTES